MYYICKWYSNYIVFDDTNKRLAHQAGKEVFEAINNFKDSTWNTTLQSERNIHIADNCLIDQDISHKVIFQLPHLDITKESHPEFLI